MLRQLLKAKYYLCPTNRVLVWSPKVGNHTKMAIPISSNTLFYQLARLKKNSIRSQPLIKYEFIQARQYNY
jgi:cell division protein FtsI/penicillin-binding protein 2